MTRVDDNDSGLSTWIIQTIEDFVNNSPQNSLKFPQREKAWGKPLVGFSRGDDPLFEKLREDIGSAHWTPEMIFNMAFPEKKVSPDQLTVITWILPKTEATKADNRRETRIPSERWVRARIYGESFNDKLRMHLVEILMKSGYRAVAPVIFPHWDWGETMSERYGMASNWSERHAAYVAGLGTFGLCEGLITPLGKAVRFGSVVAEIAIPPKTRPYQDHHAYCLFFKNGTCRECIERCPAGAVTEKGHDKVKCWDYIERVTAEHTTNYFEGAQDGCGFCQTLVPCESGIPLRKTSQESDSQD